MPIRRITQREMKRNFFAGSRQRKGPWTLYRTAPPGPPAKGMPDRRKAATGFVVPVSDGTTTCLRDLAQNSGMTVAATVERLTGLEERGVVSWNYQAQQIVVPDGAKLIWLMRTGDDEG